MIISQTGGSVGLGFSIPANTAKLIVEQIISFGEAKEVGWVYKFKILLQSSRRA